MYVWVLDVALEYCLLIVMHVELQELAGATSS